MKFLINFIYMKLTIKINQVWGSFLNFSFSIRMKFLSIFFSCGQMEDSNNDITYVLDKYEDTYTHGQWEESHISNIQETPTCHE